MIRIAIVDDEKEEVVKLTETVDNFFIEKEMEYKILPFYCGEDLLQCNIPVDIAFLDVKMGELNGIETAQRLRNWNKWAALIYVTSYGDYISKAMTFHPFAYITKPFHAEQIFKTLEDYLMYTNSMKAKSKEYFQLKTDNFCCYFEMDDIYYFYYCEDRTVEVKMKNERYRIKDSITNIYNIVNRQYFIMPAPSMIVNVQHIKKIDVKNKKLILENGEEILISRRKYKEIFDALNRFMTNGEL